MIGGPYVGATDHTLIFGGMAAYPPDDQVEQYRIVSLASYIECSSFALTAQSSLSLRY